MILNCEIDYEVLIILGRPLLGNERELVDVKYDLIKFQVNNKEVMFNVCKYINEPKDIQVISITDDKVDDSMKMDFTSKPPTGILLNYRSEDVKVYDKVVDS